MNKERKKRRLNFQKIFNLISFSFILACIIFYGYRFIKLYTENNKTEDIITLADKIKENTKEDENFKKINNEYYFTGDVNNNYLKYSNILFRIIRINIDGTVTAVSENSLTSLYYGNDKTYESSYINSWLNNQNKEYTGILENNLNNSSNYLTYTKTCKDKINDTKTITCKEKTEDITITIPSLNDYVNTGGSKGFMNNEEYFYLANTNNNKKAWYVDSQGKVNTEEDSDILGVKPVITIKSIIAAKDGDGTKDNPYTFEEETSLLGSYVSLGDSLWRVYNIEDDTVKLSLDGYLNINSSEVKYSYSNNGYYHNDSKSGTLAYYLKNNYLEKQNYKDKIEEYKFSNGIYNKENNFDYTKTLNTKVDTKISVLSIGDIILNSKNTNYFSSTGTSKTENLVYVFQNDFKAYTKSSSTSLKIVPVISVKKDKLSGEGTENSPYEVK